MEPVGAGVTGEILIGGAGLARGYVGRPDLTAEKFIPDPFRGEGGARVYRTGDVGRYREDGAIEYVGRVDQQVKIRGFRVELEEIEACLREHEGVTEAVVISREDAGGDLQLVGYVVGEDAEAVSESELRRYLAGRLPEYMVPARVALLNELPLTPNGKVDRRALPAPGQSHAKAGGVGREQHSILEEMLADVWSHVLNVERVGLA